ncbi:MAG TPA: hypothetical protein VL091_15245 [Marinobacter sp.]|nr:hypothetical protein [Marinobacter sp.]
MICANTQIPTTGFLSNGRYHILVTSAGGGFSRQHETALTRWQEDFTRDNWGTFIYVRDLATRDYWSASLQPTLRCEANYQASLSGAKAALDSSAFEVSTHTEITVIPDDDVELRRITITNHADKRRELDLTSYAEIVLDSPAVDDAHPAFSKLFVETEVVGEAQAIVCHRRGETRQPWLFHSAFADDADRVDNAGISYETDRARFLGRGCTTANPAAMSDFTPLAGTQGSVLDPIVSVRCPVALEPEQSATVTYLFGAAENREACLQLLSKYRNSESVDRGFQQASQQFQSDLQELKLTEHDIGLFDHLASSVIYGNSSLRADPDTIVKNQRDQSGLCWGTQAKVCANKWARKRRYPAQ